ncbi:3-oxoacyl-ACP reductase [Candidatus Woesearchaeota archaeon]|nr:3-oxoacyl-ACP reductase [Candidatus Woesearchaeota archaeon]
MKLESVQAVFPSRKLTNADLVELIHQHSQGTFKGDLNKALRRIALLLKYSGAEERYWLGDNEAPVLLMSTAVNKALEEANLSKQEIDLLIYAGIDKGFTEPSQAHFVANALGMDKVECFDILEGCMSWSRAVKVTYAIFAEGAYKHIMIVNGEFAQTRKDGPGYPANFMLRNLDQIAWTFPTYTVGEAATATILSRDPNRKWEFCISSSNDLVDLCTIPLEGYEGYCSLSDRIGRNGTGRFTSFGKELHEKGKPEAIKVFRELGEKVPPKNIKAIFPHTSSKTEWDDAAKKLGVKHLLYHIYPSYGNIATASVPAGIVLAASGGCIKRGDRVAGWVGSSGTSFAAYSFVY